MKPIIIGFAIRSMRSAPKDRWIMAYDRKRKQFLPTYWKNAMPLLPQEGWMLIGTGFDEILNPTKWYDPNDVLDAAHVQCILNKNGGGN